MYTLNELGWASRITQVEIEGKWVPARPMVKGFWSRLKDAWLVLIGKADAVIWPEGQ